MDRLAPYLHAPLAPYAFAWFVVSLIALGYAGSPTARRILLPIIGAGCIVLILMSKGV